MDIRDVFENCGLEPIPALHHVEFCIDQADVDDETRRRLRAECWQLAQEVTPETE